MRPATLAPLAACAAALTVITSCLVASPAAAAGRSGLPLLGYIPATATHKLDRFDPAGPQLLTLLKDPSRGHGWLVPVSGRTGRADRRIALDGEPNGIVFAR